MGKVIIIGMQIMWGFNKVKPLLPPGYVYIEERRCWLLAESPCGRRYYVSMTTLYRQVITTRHTLGLDDRETIELPQKQLT